MARRMIMFSLSIAIVSMCVFPAYAGQKDDGISAEEQAVLNAIIYNLIRSRSQTPPPPPPPPPLPKKSPEEAPAPAPDGPQL